MERKWLKEALFAGTGANSFKLGTVLTGGWFWMRRTGCSLLYRGDSMETIDFANIVAVTEAGAQVVSVPGYIQHSASTTYFYVIRRANCCGQQGQDLSTAVKVSFDADGNLAEPRPNNVFAPDIKQTCGDKVELSWFYSPIEQGTEPACFKVYYDGGTGQVDYQNYIAEVEYKGQGFYSYRSDSLNDGRYKFAVRAEDINGVTCGWLGELKIEVKTASPDAIDILAVESV